jgi:hypothetical protein
VTEDEIEQQRFPTPSFGDFEALVKLLMDLLRKKGYGEIT